MPVKRSRQAGCISVRGARTDGDSQIDENEQEEAGQDHAPGAARVRFAGGQSFRRMKHLR